MEIKDTVFQDNLIHKKNKTFILAGGKGVRLKPFTDIFPKPLLPVNGKPILENIMDNFSNYGFRNFILSLNYKSEIIKLYFNNNESKDKYENVDYVCEDIPLGTIGSLYLAKDAIKETFFITNSDIIIQEDLNKILNFHKRKKSILTIIGCEKTSVLPYGVLNLDKNKYLLNIAEKPKYENIINTGVYVAEPEIFKYLQDNKRKDITELISEICKKNEKVSVYTINNDQWFDIGQWDEYKKTKKFLEKI